MTACALCGNEAEGFAEWDGKRLCHGDHRDCYHLCTVWAGVTHEQLERVLRMHREANRMRYSTILNLSGQIDGRAHGGW